MATGFKFQSNAGNGVAGGRAAVRSLRYLNTWNTQSLRFRRATTPGAPRQTQHPWAPQNRGC